MGLIQKPALPPINAVLFHPDFDHPLFVQKVAWSSNTWESVTVVLRTNYYFKMEVGWVMDYLCIPNPETLDLAIKYAQLDTCRALVEISIKVATDNPQILIPYAPALPTQQDMGFKPYDPLG